MGAIVVLDCSEFQGVLIADVRIQLHRPARSHVLVDAPRLLEVGRRNRGSARRRLPRQVAREARLLVIRLGALGVDVEEQVIGHQRTAHVEAVGQAAGPVLVIQVVQLAVRPVLGRGVVRGVVRGCTPVTGIGIVDVLVLAAHGGRRVDRIDAALPLVGTALGHDAHHATGAAAVFGTVATEEHLLLRDRIERQRAGADGRQRIRDRIAVDVVGVFRCSRTTEAADVARRRVVRGGVDDAGRQQGDRIDVTRHGHLLQLIGGEHRAGVGLRHVDRRSTAAGHDDGFERTRGSSEVDLGA